jgi:hypothetical protein
VLETLLVIQFRVRKVMKEMILLVMRLDRFKLDIPPYPFPENQQSKLGIFTLESFYFTSQGIDDYVSGGVNGLPANSLDDISGFYVEVNGLGLRPQLYTTNGLVI